MSLTALQTPLKTCILPLLRASLFFSCPAWQAERGDLGSPPNLELLKALKPAYWFSAHLHCKFAAVVPHGDGGDGGGDGDDGGSGLAAGAPGGFSLPGVPVAAAAAGGGGGGGGGEGAAAAAAAPGQQQQQQQGRPASVTRFLALDKCLPGRQFLQVVELEARGPLRLEYDAEWLAVLRATHGLTSLAREPPPLPPAWGARAGPPQEDLEFVRAALAARGGAAVPANFAQTAPPHDPSGARRRASQPAGVPRNPQTEALFELIGRPFNLDHRQAGGGGIGGGGGFGGGGGGAQQRGPQLVPTQVWAGAGAASAARAPTFVAGDAGAAAGAALPGAPPPPRNPEEIDIDGDEDGEGEGGGGGGGGAAAAAANGAATAAAAAAAPNPEEIDIGDGGDDDDDPMFAPVDLNDFAR